MCAAGVIVGVSQAARCCLGRCHGFRLIRRRHHSLRLRLQSCSKRHRCCRTWLQGKALRRPGAPSGASPASTLWWVGRREMGGGRAAEGAPVRRTVKRPETEQLTSSVPTATPMARTWVLTGPLRKIIRSSCKKAVIPSTPFVVPPPPCCCGVASRRRSPPCDLPAC